MNTQSRPAWYTTPAQTINTTMQHAAQARQRQLTKPRGSLGQLEQLAVQFAGYQGCERPQLERIGIVVFAADHGVCARGVSAFPQSVTGQMVANFAGGGAAINVLSRGAGASLGVVNVGTVEPLPALAGVIDKRIGPGTCDFTAAPAMTLAQTEQALAIGAEQLTDDAGQPWQLCIGGEMGIGNTTSAAAIYSAVLGLPANQTVGPGTGLDDAGVELKRQVVDQALLLHSQQLHQPLPLLACLGGFEIAALSGFYIAAAQRGIPVLLDGFISGAAALLAVALNPSIQPWLLCSHLSAEPAHHLAVQKIGAQPLLNLGMRLGEGSGAALAVPLLRAALALHNDMATFADAGVASG